VGIVLLVLTIGGVRYQNDRQKDEGESMRYHRGSYSAVVALLAFCVLFLAGCSGPGKGGPGGKHGPGGPGKGFLSTVYDTVPFDPGVDKLPPMYTGHNPELLYNSIETRRQRTLRQTGETQEQRKARMAREISLPLMGSMDFDSVYALRITPAEVRRDNRDGLIHITCRLSPAFETGRKDPAKKAFVVRHLPQLDNRHTIARQDGTRVTIEEVKFSEYAVVAVNARDLPIRASEKPQEGDRESEGERIEAAIRLTPDEARGIENGIMALLVGRLAAPYASREEISRKVTAEKPGTYLGRYHYLYMELSAIWFYDAISGRVLHRMRLK